jgi:hypothetical protein
VRRAWHRDQQTLVQAEIGGALDDLAGTQIGHGIIGSSPVLERLQHGTAVPDRGIEFGKSALDVEIKPVGRQAARDDIFQERSPLRREEVERKEFDPEGSEGAGEDIDDLFRLCSAGDLINRIERVPRNNLAHGSLADVGN